MANPILAKLYQQLWEEHVSVYANVASLALLVYDWNLTFADEVNMIWMSNARLSKLLFLWIRYFGIGTHAFIIGGMYLLTDPSPTFCSAATRIQIAAPNIMWWSVEFVFALRVWILYKKSRKLLLFLTIMYTVSIAASAVLLIKALVHIDLISMPGRVSGIVPGCFASVPTYIYGAFVIGIITTSVLCLLTVYQTIRLRNNFAKSPLVTLFLRDGVLYYFCVSVMFLVNLFMFRFGAATLKILFSGFLEAIPCMFGARVLINILSLVRKNTVMEDNTTLPISEPEFVRGRNDAGQSGTTVVSDGAVMIDDNLGTGSAFSATTSYTGTTLSRTEAHTGIQETLWKPLRGDVETGPNRPNNVMPLTNHVM